MICIRKAFGVAARAPRRHLALLLLALVACGPSPAQRSPQPAGAPIAVFVHGGGWRGGTTAAGDWLQPFFAARATPLRAIDYRKPPAATLADSVADVAAALNGAAARGPVVAIGHSAGAHLAAAAALGSAPAPVACLILLDGIGYDLAATLRERPGLVDRTGVDPDRAAPLSPVALAARTRARPAIFIAAGGDARGTAAQAQSFADTLKRLGFDVTLRLFPQAAHGDFLRDFANPASPIAQATTAFLDRHGACRGSPH